MGLLSCDFVMLPICMCQPSSLLLRKQCSALKCRKLGLVGNCTKYHMMASACRPGLILE